jgi:flagellin-like hook-associated protein FlgL
VTLPKNHRKIAIEISRRMSAQSGCDDLGVASGVDLAGITSAASAVAHGRLVLGASAAEVRATPSKEQCFGSVLKGAANDVKALVSKMTFVAQRASSQAVTAVERRGLQGEFCLLRFEIDQVVWVAKDVAGAKDTSGAGRMPSQWDAVSGGATLDALSSAELGLAGSAVRLDSARESQWAVFRLDAAADAVDDIRDELGTVEAGIDIALQRLSDFIDSLVPASTRLASAHDAMMAAESVRLRLMLKNGISEFRAENRLQRSVNALLQ